MTNFQHELRRSEKIPRFSVVICTREELNLGVKPLISTVYSTTKRKYLFHTLSLSSLVSKILLSFLERGLAAEEEAESVVVAPSRSVMLANNQC